MMRAIIILPLIVVVAAAQEKPLPDADRSLPVTRQQSTSLPAFDLPDFVITGRESIDLPVAEKQSLSDRGPLRASRRPGGTPAMREHPSFRASGLPRVQTEDDVRRNGRVYLGLGSFSTFSAGGDYFGSVDNLQLGGELQYETTKGFDVNTDVQLIRTHARVSSPVSLVPDVLAQTRVRVSGGYARRAYRWYGSPTPDARRIVSEGSGEVGLSGSFRNGSIGSLFFAYTGGSVKDTTATVGEDVMHVGANLNARLFSMPTKTTIRLMNGSGSFGAFEARSEFDWSPLPLLTTRFALGIASVWGSDGQSQTRVLPGFYAAFRITPDHHFFGKYDPGIRLQNRMSLTSTIPYLTGEASIRQLVLRNRGAIGIESNWGNGIRSALSLEASTMSDYPVVSDTGEAGIFRLYYGDVTETLLKGSVVAKLPANHYFSAIAIVRSSKSSTSGLSVPYLPSSELRIHYRNPLTDRLEASGTLQAVSGREASITGGSATVAGYVRVDLRVTYAVIRGLKAWAAAENVLNAKIHHWVNYKERPFTLSIGASYIL